MNLYKSFITLSSSAKMGHLCNNCPDPPGVFNLYAVLLHKVLLQRKEEEKEAESEVQSERTERHQYNITGERMGILPSQIDSHWRVERCGLFLIG